jgi:hypothetical protein
LIFPFQMPVIICDCTTEMEVLNRKRRIIGTGLCFFK